MKIEHFALQVEDAAAVAVWYAEQLGFTVKRAADNGYPIRFVADESDDVMIEFYSKPAIEIPNYAAMDPLVFHIAFVCDNLPATIERLVAAGSLLVSGPKRSDNGDELAMLRDPWGLAIQLCYRSIPMV
ncbi:Glyoxalase-like domain protein [Planctomycetes bacterium CA13]|uniref:Glyoxalase-like domain protein n=2 Tax=Novipirellula herctigrandis TaxID=2527986 RepID=A0A5C5Z968_9BACT|nr:Glyoxalase-like domain protein [Planctomycetes bacterium CA13]